MSLASAISVRPGMALALAVSLAFAAPASMAHADGGLEPLSIDSGGKSHAFQVEVMRTDEGRARGLMFRRFMPADRGMLFDFKTEQPVTMWMRNTFIPLDMIFIARDGKIISIAENAEPHSERIIPSGGAALGVLEVNGGVAARLGFKPGDVVRHSMFGSK